MSKKYSYSRNEEIYTSDEFDTVEQACQAAAADVGIGENFWVGENVPPTPPEYMWSADDWLEHVSVQDDYGGEHAEGWDVSTKEEREELESLVRPILAAWLDRHGNRPQFWNIASPQKFYVAGKVGDLFEIEAL